MRKRPQAMPAGALLMALKLATQMSAAATQLYMLSTIALPNSEHLSSFAPVIRRSKS